MKMLKKMKSLRFSALIALVLFIALFSTSNAKSDKNEYQTTDLSGIDRESWKSLHIKNKIPVYKTFSTESKRTFWQLKHEELKKLDWSPAELEHINSLYVVICEDPILMERGVQSEEIEDRFEIFMYNWKEHARDILGWTWIQVFAVSGSGEEVLNTRGDLNIRATVGTQFSYAINTRSGDCSCPEMDYNEHMIPYCFPHPYDCSMFIMCAWGVGFEMFCPAGLHFDAWLGICNYPDFADCASDSYF